MERLFMRCGGTILRNYVRNKMLPQFVNCGAGRDSAAVFLRLRIFLLKYLSISCII